MAVRALPASRREWGEAMQAELATIDGSWARRRYALGCTRAVATVPEARRAAGPPFGATLFGAVVLLLALGIDGAIVQAEVLALVAVLGSCAWLGRRAGPLGPVAGSAPARRARFGGYAIVGVTVMYFVIGVRFSHEGHRNSSDATRGWIFVLVLALYLVTFLIITSRPAAASIRTLRLAMAVPVAAAAAWLPLLLLSSDVRAHPEWAHALVAVSVLLGLIAVAIRSRSVEQTVLAGLGIGAATCGLIFLASVGTYGLAPQLSPPLSRVPGMTLAGQVEQQRTESTDPYVAELLAGALFGVPLILGMTITRNAALADSDLPGRQWPGGGALARWEEEQPDPGARSGRGRLAGEAHRWIQPRWARKPQV
jgi:hypothetical protein